MELNERLSGLSRYNMSLNTCNGSFIVTIAYPNGWVVLKPKNKEILMSQSEDTSSIFYYLTPCTNNVNIIFDCIDETVAYNSEVEMKVELFKKKVAELQDIFASETYSDLENIQFVFPKKKKIKKKKSNTDDTETPQDIPNNETIQNVLPEEKPSEQTNNSDPSELDKKILMAINENNRNKKK